MHIPQRRKGAHQALAEDFFQGAACYNDSHRIREVRVFSSYRAELTHAEIHLSRHKIVHKSHTSQWSVYLPYITLLAGLEQSRYYKVTAASLLAEMWLNDMT
uniref:AlNc14C63G4536 protein n=1 Tax=Albugo laibachii Nc14 TaxID=890382 RepID=F0WD13_9STRA|nr:AlNc14C63G4536 [Albugo laibachii Nc14]|eukprot:CCA19085.1 AlNc14C63G4536 [Albugo laibachii Nc14]